MRTAPDMFFGDSKVRFSHGTTGAVLELSSMDALRCCSWVPAPPRGLQPCLEAVGGLGPVFGNVQCQYAQRWKPRADNPDVKEFEVTSDWTYSTAYWGTLRGDSDENGAGGSPLLDLDPGAEEETGEDLPMERLRRRDTILWYNEVTFWEHELDDCGVCRLIARIRVMPTFWFVLLCLELRVDGVLIRDVCTRLFCDFDSPQPPHLLREWTWREASYEQLRLRGVNFDNAPEISSESVGTSLLEEQDVKHRIRHTIRLGGPALHKQRLELGEATHILSGSTTAI